MNIKPYDKTIRELFKSGRQFVIPRFQREYSWDKKNYQEFFEDMMGCIRICEGIPSTTQYFLGTMLFIGNFAEGAEKEIQVVDGQQRLTTITILFSALSDKFIQVGQSTLSEQVFTYIMTKDDNGEDVRIIKSKTHYPFFAYYIQDRKKEVKREPNTNEEVCIQQTYDYYYSQLSEDKLKSQLKLKHGSDVVNQLDYVEILKALRDQVLNSTFISISTSDREQANKIFEILNAKGKKLVYIDLIKNRIFEIVKSQEPVDFAEDRWQSIKTILNSGKEASGMATFYQHFWISAYSKVYSKQLYDSFIRNITPKSETRYKQFLDQMLANAKYYEKITNPKREDYDKRKEYFWIVQSLNALNNYFNVIQVRIALLALFDVKEHDLIDFQVFKDTILFLENFHFAYNAILTGRSNRVEGIYSKFAIGLRNSSDKATSKQIIKDKLIDPLNLLFPSFKDFSEEFITLTYSKRDNPSNMKTKYALNKLDCAISGCEIFSDDASVEHILPESSEAISLSIGNLIVLESKINQEAGNKVYSEKVDYYKKSRYLWIKQFLEENTVWDGSKIAERSKQLASIYYEKVLGREIPKETVAHICHQI